MLISEQLWVKCGYSVHLNLYQKYQIIDTLDKLTSYDCVLLCAATLKKQMLIERQPLHVLPTMCYWQLSVYYKLWNNMSPSNNFNVTKK